ncbi:reverse transcriptase domain-containing protein [Tanacetum coccineum]
MQEVILFYNGLGIPTRQILDSRGAIPSKTAADAKVAIQEMAEYSQKWHNGTSRSRSTKTSDGLAAIQAQLNNLGREIKKVNEKVYAAQVGCEQCKGPHYTKDCPLKEEGKTLEEAYYTSLLEQMEWEWIDLIVWWRIMTRLVGAVEVFARNVRLDIMIYGLRGLNTDTLDDCMGIRERSKVWNEGQACMRCRVITEYLVNISKRHAFWSLNEDILKIYYSDYQYAVSIKEDTAYPCLHSPKTTKERRSIRRIQKKSIRRIEDICMTRSSTNELFTPFKDLEREFRSSRRHFKTLSLDELRSHDFNLFSDQENSEEEEAKTMAETVEQYISKTRADYGSGVVRPKIEDKDNFELKGQFLKELRTNTFSGSDHEDANEHIEKVLEIMDLFHILNITIDQVMLRVFPMSLTGAASQWLRNKPTGSITTWEDLKTRFLSKYCPPARTAKKMEEINNFKQEPNENLYQAWEQFKEHLMKCPQHYLTNMHEVVLFYNGLDVPNRQILNSRGAIPSKTAADAKTTIQEMVNEKVYAAQVGCEQCKGPHYTKDFPLKEEGKTVEEAYYMQFGGPFQGGEYRATAPRFYQRNNANPSY